MGMSMWQMEMNSKLGSLGYDLLFYQRDPIYQALSWRNSKIHQIALNWSNTGHCIDIAAILSEARRK